MTVLKPGDTLLIPGPKKSNPPNATTAKLRVCHKFHGSNLTINGQRYLSPQEGRKTAQPIAVAGFWSPKKIR